MSVKSFFSDMFNAFNRASSPRTAWEAFIGDIKWENQIYHDLSVNRAYGPDRYRRYLDGLSTTLYKKIYGESEAGDRAGFQMSFMQTLPGVEANNLLAKIIMFGVLKAAQEAGMFDDVLDLFDRRNGVPDVINVFRRYGFEDWMFDEVKQNAMRTIVFKTMFGTSQDGLHVVNKIQDAGIKGGNYTAMDVTKVYNPRTRQFEYKEWNRFHTPVTAAEPLDHMDYLTTIWIKRFQSPDAGNSMGKIRKESFMEDEVLVELMRKGFFTTRHMSYQNIRNMRNCLEYLQGKMGLIWASGFSGQLFMESMYNSPLNDRTPVLPRSKNPTRLIMNIPFLVSCGEVDISSPPASGFGSLATYATTPEFHKNPDAITGVWEVLTRLKLKDLLLRNRADEVRQLKAAVIACPTMSRAFKAEIAAM